MSASTAPLSSTPDRRETARRNLRRAWWSLAFYPLTFVVAFVVGEGLATVLVEEGADPAVWQMLLAGIPAMVVFVLPGVAAYFFGRRALRAGTEDAKAPMLIGALVALGFVGLNVVSGIAMVLFG